MDAGTRTIVRGYGNDERPVCEILWARDSIGSTAATSEHGVYDPDHRHVDFRQYYDPAFAAAEMDRVWTKKWLFAGREEDIPLVGDRMPFQVGSMSFLIIRSDDDTLRAFYNSCLHRGTELCSKRETGATIRCPYHAWEWNVDGRLKRIPSHWDFPDVSRLNGSLPEVRLDIWGGFIFINCDAEAPALLDVLGPIPGHLESFAPERRYTKMRFRKKVRANWKVVQGAFMESYHLYATHPEGVRFTGDSQTKYDIFPTPGAAVGRMAVPSAEPSMFADASATAYDAAIALAEVVRAWHYPDAPPISLDPSRDARAEVGDWHRRTYEQTYGRPNLQPDAIMVDSILYFLYPHFTLWLSETTPLVYQFTPDPSDPEMSYFDVRLLMPYAEGSERPPSALPIEIGADETVAEGAPEFKFLAMIFDQDMNNMPRIQRGLRSSAPTIGHTNLGIYQESLIQHWHELLEEHVGESWTSIDGNKRAGAKA